MSLQLQYKRRLSLFNIDEHKYSASCIHPSTQMDSGTSQSTRRAKTGWRVPRETRTTFMRNSSSKVTSLPPNTKAFLLPVSCSWW